LADPDPLDVCYVVAIGEKPTLSKPRPAMVKAIARAFRWREMLENGTHATITEIAATEKINESYVWKGNDD
jgi:hypothetical protein